MKLWPKNNLYDGAPEVWADFGSFGRKHVDINFNLNNNRKTVQLYKKILDK